MTNTNHPWSSDPVAQAAVRAAEDAEAAKRVPPPDHRDLPAAVAELRERVGRLEALVGKAAVAGVFDGVGVPPSPATRPGEATPADGLRTERVTLEITRLIAERDAAIREREEVKARVAEFEKTRRLEIERIENSCIRVCFGDHHRAVGCEWEYFVPASRAENLQYQRTEAIRERDEARADLATMRGKCEGLKDRVAELESEVAARPMGWIARHEQPPPVGKYVMCRWDVSARPGYAREVGYGVAKRGPDGMWRAPNGVEKIAPMHWMPLLPGVEGGDDWESPPAAAPAANAGGVYDPEQISGDGKTNCQGKLDSSQEPVAWGVMIDSGRGLYGHYDFESEARGVRDAVNAEEGWSMTVVPLYAAPPPPRGWLTEEERSLVESLRATFQQNADSLRSAGLVGHVENWDRKVRLFDALLARSTPPRVNVPMPWHFHTDEAEDEGNQAARDRQWKEAIREAGWEVE